MQNFDYHTPTRLIFGKGVITHLPDVLRPLGKRVLLTYGAGSIKKIGLYDKVQELLKGFEVYIPYSVTPQRQDPAGQLGRHPQPGYRDYNRI